MDGRDARSRPLFGHLQPGEDTKNIDRYFIASNILMRCTSSGCYYGDIFILVELTGHIMVEQDMSIHNLDTNRFWADLASCALLVWQQTCRESYMAGFPLVKQDYYKVMNLLWSTPSFLPHFYYFSHC